MKSSVDFHVTEAVNNPLVLAINLQTATLLPVGSKCLNGVRAHCISD